MNLQFARENSGAGGTAPAAVDTDAFRKRLWNATMDGQYPTYATRGRPAIEAVPFDAKYLNSPGAQQMSHWFQFFDDTRHWELEPYFDVDGGRAMALEGVEYIVYVEKPGPIEVGVEKHGYDVSWFNPDQRRDDPAEEMEGRALDRRAAGRVPRLGAAHRARRP